MSTPANDTGTGTEKDDGKSPYKGLRPYEKSDEDNFFGRDGETRILADKILSRKLTLLFAASGIGKSSLLQAALLPALERPDPPSHDALDVVYCNDWVKEPGVTLKKKVADELRRRHRIPQDYPLPLDSPLGPFLRRCTLFSSDPLVLILDQFEEFFNYQRHQPEFRPFIREMSAAIRDDATATRFLFSMREDFALELNAFKPELPTLLFDNYFRLEALSRDSARTVILEPLKRVGCDCEPALLEALLNSLGKYNGQPDSGSQPGGRLLELPPARIEPAQVQIICTQLWEKEHADRSRQLRLDTYQTMGGTDGLLKRYFEAKVAPLSAAQRALASRAFDFLVSSQGTKMAYPLYELLNRTGVRDADALAAVLVELEQARVLRRQERMETRDDRTEWEPYYELYHDLFAKAVNDWNRDYKIRRARRRTVFRVTGAVACSLLLAAVWNIVYQRTHDHLRLTPPAGLSDRIELWSGTRHDFDLIGQRSFRAETRLLRNEVAPDKQLEHAPVGDYDQLNIELIGLMSLIERIDAYREAGLEEQGLELARRTLVGRDPNASAKASQRLARFRNPETGAVVERFLGDEPDSERRRQLVAGWLGLPTTHALRRLEQASRDNAKEVRQQVAAMLGGFAGQPSGEQAVALLVDLLKDPDPVVRRSAASALGHFAGQPGGEQAIAPLVDLLKDPVVGRSAASALGHFAGQPGGEQAAAPLVDLLKDSDRDVRGNAADALGHFAGQHGGEQAIAPLVDLLKDPVVGRSAASALGHFAGQPGGEQAAGPLVDLLKDSDRDVRGNAADALGGFAGQPGGEQAVALLVDLLKDPDPVVRRSAADALGGFAGQPGGEQAVAPLVDLLKDPDRDVRNSATRALGGFAGQPGGDQAIAPLVDLLKDPNSISCPPQRGQRHRPLCRAARRRASRRSAGRPAQEPGPGCPQHRGQRPRPLCRAARRRTGRRSAGRPAQGPGTVCPPQRGQRPRPLCRADRRRTGRHSAGRPAQGPERGCPRQRGQRPRRLCRAARRRTDHRSAGPPAQGPELECPPQRGRRPRRLCRAARRRASHRSAGPPAQGPEPACPPQRGQRPRRLCRAARRRTGRHSAGRSAQGPEPGCPQQRDQRPPPICGPPQNRGRYRLPSTARRIRDRSTRLSRTAGSGPDEPGPACSRCAAANRDGCQARSKPHRRCRNVDEREKCCAAHDRHRGAQRQRAQRLSA
jgi:HEAT repeat protein